jgi:hypothetical protein
MHDEFINQRHGTFIFVGIVDGIAFFFLLLRYEQVDESIHCRVNVYVS